MDQNNQPPQFNQVPLQQSMNTPPINPTDTSGGHKALVTSIIVVVLLLGAGAGYAFYRSQQAPAGSQVQNTESQSQAVQNQTEDPTASWKTYRNEEYGYEIKYPANAKLRISDLDKGAAGEKYVNTFPNDHDYITLEKDKAFVSLCRNCGPYGVGDGQKFVEDVVLDGQTFEASGFYTDVADINTNKIALLKIPNLDIHYGFRSDYRSSLTLEEKRLAEKFIKDIFSTFKFIDSNIPLNSLPSSCVDQQEAVTRKETMLMII